MPRRKKTDRSKLKFDYTTPSFEDTVQFFKDHGGPLTNEEGHRITVRTSVDPTKLSKAFNQLNWKKHTKRQLNYVDDSIKTNGWAGQPVYCANTDRLINGNGRVSKAIEQEYKTIPIDVGWWTYEEGNDLLASIDTTSQMATVDGNALASITEAALKRSAMRNKDKTQPKVSLMADVHSFAKQILDEQRDRIGIRNSKKSVEKIIKDGKTAKKDHRETPSNHDESMYVTELKEDLHFPSEHNDYGIPDLLPSELYHADQHGYPEDTFDRSGKSLLDTNYYCYGSRPFDSNNHMKPVGGFLGFFCEDEYFNRVYNKPADNAEKLVDEQWYAIIEPDFSTYLDWPFAKRLWSVYRARWCCRYWQQLHIKIIPMLHRTNDLDQDHWMFDSLPEETTVAAMQLRMGGVKKIKDPEYWSSIGAVLDYASEVLPNLDHILFYGSKNVEKYIVGKLPEGLSYTMIEPFMDKRRVKMKT